VIAVAQDANLGATYAATALAVSRAGFAILDKAGADAALARAIFPL